MATLYSCFCLVKVSRLPLVIWFIDIEQKDITQIIYFIQGTQAVMI
jgi:hypothetical protein